ncbi:MAG: hypothetical protein WBV77_07945 [Solirubrobacteraceae bacterium]
MWVGTGSGCSAYEAKPEWQHDPGCTKRTDNDVAAVANYEESPVSVYDSYEYEAGAEGRTGKLGWVLVGGTSVASPLVTGIEAHASTTVKDEGAEAFYRHSLFDVTSGSNGKCGNYLCEAEEGYDGSTGWGTPDGPLELTPKTTAITEAATSLTLKAAKLNGYVNPGGVETSYHFEYGPTTSYGTNVPVPSGSVGSSALWQSVSQSLTGLALEGTYHYRLVATHGSESVYGADHVFTTPRWSIQTTPHPTGSEASTMAGVSCTSSTACTAVGLNDDGGFKTLAERWNGTEWSIQSTPSVADSELNGISCSSSTACISVGSGGSTKRVNVADSWNGTEWSLQTISSPKGEASELRSVSCTTSTACMAVGIYYPLMMFAERWNGTEWSLQSMVIPTGAKQSRLYGVSCTSSTACTAVGTYENSSGFYGGLVERWNGTEWAQQEIPNPAGATLSALSGVSCESSTECTAVGGYVNSSGVQLTLAEHWNGTKWSIQTTPTPLGAKGASVMLSVVCLSATDCTAVGNYYITPPSEEGQKSLTLSEFWNGTEWSIQIPANPENGLNDLAGVSCTSAAPETCIAVGDYQNGGPERMLAEKRVAIKPVVETKAATSVGETGATLNGTVNPENSESKYYFEYGTTESYGSKTAEVSVGSGTSSLEESKALTGLLASTTYYFRLVAINSGGTAYGAQQVFSTIGKPTVETKAATSIGGIGATLNGIVNPRGVETKYYFEYGTTESYGSKTAEVSAGSGTANLEESKAITGLAASTTYYFRIVATNTKGATDGSPRSFKTITPYVETTQATSVAETTATLNGIVNPEGAETKYYFEYGTTASYGTKTGEVSAGSGTSNVEVSKAISGLHADTVYYFRTVATDGVVADGVGRAFATAPWSWSITSTPNPTGEKTSRLEGTSCTSPAACTAVGSYDSSSGATLALAEVWNGAEWKEQTTLKPTGATETELDGVSCTSLSACTAVGSYLNSSGVAVPLAERWNGEAWSIQEPPSPTGAKGSGLFNVSCASSSACTAVGAYISSAGVYTTLAENWNGTSWSIKETPNPTGAKISQLLDVSCTSSNACTAVGEYENSAGTAFLAQAEIWNGETWSLQEPPSPTGARDTWPEGVSCTSASMCTAVGFYEPGTGGKATLAEGWNGKTWSVQSTANPTGAQNSNLRHVSCTSSAACTAVGTYTPKEGEVGEATLAEQWNGTEWSIQSSPNPTGAPANRLLAVSCTSFTTCIAVGYYDKSKSEESRVTLAEIYR